MNNKDLVKSGEKREKLDRKGKRPDRAVQLMEGEATQYVNEAMLLYALPPCDINSKEGIGVRIEEYFTICAENDIRPSVAGMALALGVERNMINNWIVTGSKGDEITRILKKARQTLDFLMDQYMQRGKINPVSGIFLMKNNLGYKDQQEVVITPQNPFGDMQDRKTLEERYLESMPDAGEDDVIDTTAEDVP